LLWAFKDIYQMEKVPAEIQMATMGKVIFQEYIFNHNSAAAQQHL
jgi:hypothetical protein